MRSSVFSRLAATNLKNNRKTYVPYILTSILTVMMYYIMDGLSKNPYVTEGNEPLQICLQYANGIIIVFAVILGMFFIAVLCVILGTYALFIAGSIVLLKLLRRNKRYYYQTKHFTAVSGMIYRMKQNAVGLANICILSTMVLVMVSTTVSLYVGVDDVLKTRFPNEFQINLKRPDVASEQRIADIVSGVTEKNGVKPVSETGYHYGSLTAFLEKNEFQLYGVGDYSAEDACGVTLIPLEDYNKMEETTVNLADDEVLLFYDGTDTFNQDTISLDGRNYRVAKELDGMKIKKKSASEMIATYYIIMKDTNQIQACLDDAYQNSDLDEEWKALYQSMDYQYAFDMQGDEEHKTQAMTEIRNRITQEVPEAFCAGRELNRESFYSLYGGLLFIGIYLGAIFLMATVLIIYYKQISEGYDDRERYQIMQKVGMSKKEVKRSIQSQILTVFFLPLVAAVIHIAVAFRIITKLLVLLNLVNVPLFMNCTIATVVVFAVFYGIVYALTAREYYRLVN